MERSATAEGDHGEGGYVLAVLHSVDPCCVGHVLVDHLGNSDRSGVGVHVQCLADHAIQGCPSRVVVQVDAGCTERVG